MDTDDKADKPTPKPEGSSADYTGLLVVVLIIALVVLTVVLLIPKPD